MQRLGDDPFCTQRRNELISTPRVSFQTYVKPGGAQNKQETS